MHLFVSHEKRSSGMGDAVLWFACCSLLRCAACRRGISVLKGESTRSLSMRTGPTKHYLLASDFDQTLSFNDSGHVLSEMLGVTDFEHKVTGLARSNLV